MGLRVPAQSFSSFRDKDDLTGWIYAQIQYTAQDPAHRSGQLVKAVAQAWRQPRSSEEQQAWLDLLTNEGYSLLLGGSIVASTDAYTAAYEYARQHAEVVDAPLVLETVLKPLGNNYTRLGDYDQAFFIHQKALALALALGDRAALAGVYSNLANTAGNMGRAALARDFCIKGLAVAKPGSAIAGLLLSEASDAYRALGKMDSARWAIGRSVSVLQSSQADAAAGYWLLTAYQQAGDLYGSQRGVGAYGSLQGGGPYGYGSQRVSGAAGLRRTGEPYGSQRVALGFYQKALALQRRLALRAGELRQRDRAKLFYRVGALYARLGQTGPAKQWLDSCLAVLLPGRTVKGLRDADLYAENTLGDALYILAGVQGSVDEAIRLYELAFAAERKGRQELITTSSRERFVGDSRRRYGKVLDLIWGAWIRGRESKYAVAMLRIMESSKAQLLLDEVLQQQQQRVAAKDSVGDRIKLLEKAEAYYKKEMIGGGDSAGGARLREMDWELARLRRGRRLARGADSIGSLRGGGLPGRPLSVGGESTGLPPGVEGDAGVAAGLPPGVVARSFFAGDSVLYTIESGQEGVRFVDRAVLGAGWQDSVRGFIHRWFGQGASTMIDHPAEYYKEAYGWYERLFGGHPFDSGVAYILLPDGALSLLPVEALVTKEAGGSGVAGPAAGSGETGRGASVGSGRTGRGASVGWIGDPGSWPFVIRSASISYGWSLRTLYQQQLTKGGSFAGFFVSSGRGSHPVLQAALTEEAGIAPYIREGHWFVDSQATTKVFASELASASILHVSSHAFTGRDSLDAPHIELYDTGFYLFELRALDLHPGLIVLSACKTGDGRWVSGEGVQSLARGFTAGGAAAVVAGWWNVNDEAAAKLMDGFYAQLATGAEGPGWRGTGPGWHGTGAGGGVAGGAAGSGGAEGAGWRGTGSGGGIDAAQALRLSKLAWLDDRQRPALLKLPYYWAALNYQGNPMPFANGTDKLFVRRSPSWAWVFGLILAIGVLAVVLIRRLKKDGSSPS